MNTFLNAIWAKKNYRIAVIIALCLLLWLLSGLVGALFSKGDGPAVLSHTPVNVMTVRARYEQAQLYSTQLRVRGRSEANRDVSVRAEIGGQVLSVPIVKGSPVNSGDVICELAAEDRPLRLAEAKAALSKAQLDYDGALRLKSGGYQSRTAIASAKSQLELSKANVKRRELDVARLQIRAPFDGVADERPVEVGDLMERGDSCATVLDLNPLVIAGQVSETEVSRFQVGVEAHAQLRTGEVVQGRVRFISRHSDRVTRTFRVEVEIENPELTLRSGITAQLNIPTGDVSAYEISPALLALDDAGDIGIRVLDEEHIVRFMRVKIEGDSAAGIWVSGLPENVLLITVGQEYVAGGQKVSAVIEEPLSMNAAR